MEPTLNPHFLTILPQYIAKFEITILLVFQHVSLRKEKATNMKCPVCSDKLDIDIKLKSAQCHSCGWNKIFKVKV